MKGFLPHKLHLQPFTFQWKLLIVFFFDRKSRERVVTTVTETKIFRKYKDCPFFLNST